MTCKLVQTELQKEDENTILKKLDLSKTEIEQFSATGVEQIKLGPNDDKTEFINKQNIDFENFVLKEMAEGGYSQVYTGSTDIIRILTDESRSKNKHFLLMKKVVPETRQVFKISEKTVKDGVKQVEITQELGIFGCFVLDKDKKEIKKLERDKLWIYSYGMNDVSGYIVRSKNAESVYGSFSKGTAMLDSIRFSNK